MDNSIIKFIKGETSNREKELLDFYWKYFELQSNQRNHLCTVYFALISALISSYVLIHSLDFGDSFLLRFICLVMIASTAFIFYHMFKRSTILRNSARKSIIDLQKILGVDFLPKEETDSLEGDNQRPTHTNLLQYQALGVIVFSVICFLVEFVVLVIRTLGTT